MQGKHSFAHYVDFIPEDLVENLGKHTPHVTYWVWRVEGISLPEKDRRHSSEVFLLFFPSRCLHSRLPSPAGAAGRGHRAPADRSVLLVQVAPTSQVYNTKTISFRLGTNRKVPVSMYLQNRLSVRWQPSFVFVFLFHRTRKAMMEWLCILH